MRCKLAVIAALFMFLGASPAMADDVECPEDKAKTCFMDGGDNVSCICVNASDNRADPEFPEVPDSPNPSEYEPPISEE